MITRTRSFRAAAITAATGGLLLTMAAAPVQAAPAQAAPSGVSAGWGHGPHWPWWPPHHHNRTIDVQLLALNDFHGNLEPPGGSSGRITTGIDENGVATQVDAGGVAYLATHLKQARKGHRNSLTVAAGDLVGASPLLSGAFHDEPTIEAMNELGLDVSSVGNHEFDEGKAELLRLQNGGCRTNPDGSTAADSCADGRFRGAKFPYLSANVINKDTHRPLLAPFWIKRVNGVKVGFIGMTLKGTPDIVTAAGVAGLKFKDEVRTANHYARLLNHFGVKSIVTLIHQGGVPASGVYDYDCNAGGSLGLTGPIVDIAQRLSRKIDLVVTGHTHQAYTCDIPDPVGRSRMVTSASSFGRLFTDIELRIDRRTRDVVRSSVDAKNMVVTRDVAPDPKLSALVARYNTLVAPIANREVGYIADTILGRGCSTAGAPCPVSGEEPAGDLIADAQLSALAADPLNSSGADFAVMNPGGIRADLVCTTAPCPVSYGAAFNVQPFTNFMKVVDLSGADVQTMFAQQWTTQNPGEQRILQISDNVRFTYDPAAADNTDKIVPGTLTIDGAPIDPSRIYHVAMNEFLAGGGDNFTAISNGTIVYTGLTDLDALTQYLTANSSAAAPYPVPAADRITLA
jgi:5'-nucleotidase